jgi:hypothetical protein
VSKSQEKPRKSSAFAAGIAGAVYGGIAGALIGYSFAGSDGAWIGALAGALYSGIAEAVTDIRRKPGELKPLWHRLIAAILMGAAFAVVVSLIFKNASPFVIAAVTGLFIGLMGFGPRKLALGASIGIAVGLVVQYAVPDANPAIIGGLIVLLDKLALLLVFKETEPLQIKGERVPAEDIKYVVPFEAHTSYIGSDFAETLARESDGTFKRNSEGIGIVESFDALRGPTFDPNRVNSLIREFYEHTSRFKLTIIPEWNPFIRPFFWAFKTFVAQKIGQANIPFNIKDAQRGMVSFIDTIDYQAAEDADAVETSNGPDQTLRVWIRAYQDSGEAIYVGIYTIVRHEDTGFVSVGFPLPEANFTATLLPFNNKVDGLLLSTRQTGLASGQGPESGTAPGSVGARFPGHYLSDIDENDGSLTTLELTTMDEEIDVFVEDSQLQTEHRFFFSGSRFLTLHYTIERQT